MTDENFDPETATQAEAPALCPMSYLPNEYLLRLLGKRLEVEIRRREMKGWEEFELDRVEMP